MSFKIQFLALVVTSMYTTTNTASFNRKLEIKTNSGSTIRGFEKLVKLEETQTIYTYLGIPYAEPPVGKDRFMPPKPRRVNRQEIINATEFGYSCYQLIDDTFPNFSGAEMWNPKTNLSEDCLTLNIWVPEKGPEKGLKAVMVWIYGGGFVTGATAIDVYDGAILAASEGVVVVSINYRVGALGFLALNDSIPGNNGLLDQKLALDWIYDNIQTFGGDRSKITIFGESAGAVSVGLHMLSNMSNSRFKHAIMQSGSPTTPWAILSKDVAYERGMKLAKEVNCYYRENGNKNNLTEVIKCLRDVNASHIVKNEWVAAGVYVFPFGPVVDGTFLTDHPTELLKKGSVKSTSIMIGTNLNEASYYLVYFIDKYFKKDKPSGINETQFRDIIKMELPQANPFEIDAISFQYTDWSNAGSQEMYRDATDEWIGDYNIKCPVYNFGLDYAAHDNSKVHAYYFTQRPKNSPWHEWMGAIHGEEIAFVFGQPLQDGQNFTEEEKGLSKKMMKLWATFAKSGNPTQNHYWKKFTRAKQNYLELSVSSLNHDSTAKGPRTNKCALWSQYLPKLARDTADIKESEMEWKKEFHQWSNEYMVAWKAEFNNYIADKENKCAGTGKGANRNEL
ncbi:cholinesterase 2-like [Anneissia japonica]|uniref:cholinesterase 2-like n=1 Tax=Anneissia japonica TaxID=1529436 RepID=UPI001425A8F9|nr:cholinesterase 2-like [Anneissia japonica]XP_033122601.1 cholinesterase 2-like [Anneissia japonica]